MIKFNFHDLIYLSVITNDYYTHSETSSPDCDFQNIRIGWNYFYRHGMVNTSISPTCFSCLDLDNQPIRNVEEIRIGGSPVLPNSNITLVNHQLVVDNFDSLVPSMSDGVLNEISCVTDREVIRRSVSTLSKENLYLCVTDGFVIKKSLVVTMCEGYGMHCQHTVLSRWYIIFSWLCLHTYDYLNSQVSQHAGSMP